MSANSSTQPYEALRAFLDGYCQQDMAARFGNPIAAARAFASEAGQARALQAARELEQFMDEHRLDPRWREALARLGGTWMPRTRAAVPPVVSALRTPPNG